jgi:hypothetical protein
VRLPRQIFATKPLSETAFEIFFFNLKNSIFSHAINNDKVPRQCSILHPGT